MLLIRYVICAVNVCQKWKKTCLLLSYVSAPLSLPARSTKEILPTGWSDSPPRFSANCSSARTASWDIQK